jgi:hypothetical protein
MFYGSRRESTQRARFAMLGLTHERRDARTRLRMRHGVCRRLP